MIRLPAARKEHSIMSLHLLSYLESTPTLDPFSRSIVESLMVNAVSIPYSSAESMADLCNVSPSALRKFVISIGYESYTDFKLSFRNFYDKNYDPEGFLDHAADQKDLHSVCDGICSAVRLAEDQIPDNAMQLALKDMIQAETIVLCSNSSNSVQILTASQLALRGKKLRSIHLPKVLSDITKDLTGKTLIMIIRVGRNTNCYRTADIASLSPEVRTCLISSYVNPLEKTLFTHTLCFNGTNGLEDEYGVDAIMMCLLYNFMAALPPIRNNEKTYRKYSHVV